MKDIGEPAPTKSALIALAVAITLGVVSNKHVNFVNLFLEKLNIHTFFDLIIGDDGQMVQKPAPTLFYSVIKPLFPELNNSEVLMVGDTAVDLLFAKNAQIDACWAAYGYGDRHECVSLEPTFVINNIEELSSIII